jgi:hydrogenase maturation protease
MAVSSTAGHEILILGVGNPLMGDDGAGVRAVELLEKAHLPAHFQVQEIGTPGWSLGAWFEGYESVVLIDAVQMGLKPGAWQKIDLRETCLRLPESAFSLHQADLAGGLLLAQELDLLPRSLTLYGIEPADLTPGASLSPQVASSLPELVNSIVDDFQRKP